MSFLNCSRSSERVGKTPPSSPSGDQDIYTRASSPKGSRSPGSPSSAREDYPGGTMSFGNEPSQYEICTVIGKGSYDAATISLAKHIPSGRTIAVRQTDLECREIDFNMVQNETVFCHQHRHECLMPYYTSFVHNHELWSVMPLMAYGSCRDLIHAYFTSGLPEQAIAYILRDVLLGLEHLHNRGIIHRGVKASHILISSTGRVCLSGMRHYYQMIQGGQKLKAVFDFPHNACKLLQWFSPEILEQNLAGYDTKSDIYSLGITACELANGYAPFTDMPATQMLLEKLSGIKPVLADSTTIADLTAEQNVTNSDVPEDSGIDSVAANNVQKTSALGYAYNRTFSHHFHHLVALCLEKNPENRPSATVLLNHPFFKHLRKRTTDALPGLLHPVTPLSDATKLPRDDSAIDDLAENMEDVSMDEEWDF